MRNISILEQPGVLPPLNSDFQRQAERLVFLAHEGVNWNIWGSRRNRYWDALTDRVRAGTYHGTTLNDWWEFISTNLDTSPKSAEARLLLAQNLITDDDIQVLQVLRNHASVLVLRLRVFIESDQTDD